MNDPFGTPPAAPSIDLERVSTHAPTLALVGYSVLVGVTVALRYAWDGAPAYAAILAAALAELVPRGEAVHAAAGARAVALWAWRSAAFAGFGPDRRAALAASALSGASALASLAPRAAGRWVGPLLVAAAAAPRGPDDAWADALRPAAFTVTFAVSEYRRTALASPPGATVLSSVGAAAWTLLAHPLALAAAPVVWAGAAGAAALLAPNTANSKRDEEIGQAPPVTAMFSSSSSSSSSPPSSSAAAPGSSPSSAPSPSPSSSGSATGASVACAPAPSTMNPVLAAAAAVLHAIRPATSHADREPPAPPTPQPAAHLVHHHGHHHHHLHHAHPPEYRGVGRGRSAARRSVVVLG